MPPRTATKIVKEFKTKDELDLIHHVLERVRQGGPDPRPITAEAKGAGEPKEGKGRRRGRRPGRAARRARPHRAEAGGGGVEGVKGARMPSAVACLFPSASPSSPSLSVPSSPAAGAARRGDWRPVARLAGVAVARAVFRLATLVAVLMLQNLIVILAGFTGGEIGMTVPDVLTIDARTNYWFGLGFMTVSGVFCSVCRARRSA